MQPLLISSLASALGKVRIEEGDERLLLGTMSERFFFVFAPLLSGGFDERTTLHVPRDDDRMHVRLSADRGCISELRGHETNRGYDVFLSLVRALALAELGKHRCRAKASAP